MYVGIGKVVACVRVRTIGGEGGKIFVILARIY